MAQAMTFPREFEHQFWRDLDREFAAIVVSTTLFALVSVIIGASQPVKTISMEEAQKAMETIGLKPPLPRPRSFKKPMRNLSSNLKRREKMNTPQGAKLSVRSFRQAAEVVVAAVEEVLPYPRAAAVAAAASLVDAPSGLQLVLHAPKNRKQSEPVSLNE